MKSFVGMQKKLKLDMQARSYTLKTFIFVMEATQKKI